MNNSNESKIRIKAAYFDEPLLNFASGRQEIDPKLGILKFGPRSLDPLNRHPKTLRVGLIGTAQSIADAWHWIETMAEGVIGPDPSKPDFPGCTANRGYMTQLLFSNEWQAQIEISEVNRIKGTRPPRTRFENCLELLESRLRFLANKDLAPEYIVVALPHVLYTSCRTVDYFDKETGNTHRDLRRAFKAIAMKYRISTQLLLQPTLEQDPEQNQRTSKKDHPSEIAWDFFNALYFKAGGLPWSPVGLIPGTCYVGIGFYRNLGSTDHLMQTALIQAFDEHGEGLVLRGPEFKWDPEENNTPSPHLSEGNAVQIVKKVLERYASELGQKPRRVVIHKTSKFWPDEKKGLEKTLQGTVNSYSLLALAPQSDVRLFPVNLYPPLRGTYFSVGNLDYLYTTGFIAELRRFQSVHVPSPLLIADHIGYDTSREDLLREILILTKMNWNGSKLGGLFPITLRFTRLVGDVMKEIPSDREPLTNFKFYM